MFSANVAKKYGTAVVEDLDLRVFARREKPEEGTRDSRGHHDNRVLADTSGFRSILTNAMSSRGGDVVKVEPAFTTKRCSVCDQVDEWNAAVSIEHRCSGCGTSWDQDMNAGRNLLRVHAERPPDPVPVAGTGLSKRREYRLLGKQKIREKKLMEESQASAGA